MKKFLSGLLVLLPCVLFATASSYVCPNTYRTIILGDSSAEVIDACGLPVSASSMQQEHIHAVPLQQWVYIPSTLYNFLPGQYHPQLAITFNTQNEVAQFSLTNQAFSNSFPCYRLGRIQIGTTLDQIRFQCGAPNYIYYMHQGLTVPITVTTLVYSFGSYRPQMIFTFQNDQLISIETGRHLAK